MKPIHIVSHDENYGIRRELTDRAARIDKLTVDRSQWKKMTCTQMSPEMERFEPRFVTIRQETTLAEKIDAWRKIEGYCV